MQERGLKWEGEEGRRRGLREHSQSCAMFRSGAWHSDFCRGEGAEPSSKAEASETTLWDKTSGQDGWSQDAGKDGIQNADAPDVLTVRGLAALLPG